MIGEHVNMESIAVQLEPRDDAGKIKFLLGIAASFLAEFNRLQAERVTLTARAEKAERERDKLTAVLVWRHPFKRGFWQAYYGGKVHGFPCRETAVETVLLYGESLLEVEAEEIAERKAAGLEDA